MSITWNLTDETAPKVSDKVVIYTTINHGMIINGSMAYYEAEGKAVLACDAVDKNAYGLEAMPFWASFDNFMLDVNTNWHDPAVTKPEMGQAAVLYCDNGDIISAQLTIPQTEGDKSVWDTGDASYGVVFPDSVKRWYPFNNVIVI